MKTALALLLTLTCLLGIAAEPPLMRSGWTTTNHAATARAALGAVASLDGVLTNAILRGVWRVPDGAVVGYVWAATNVNGSGTWTFIPSGVGNGDVTFAQWAAANVTNSLFVTNAIAANAISNHQSGVVLPSLVSTGLVASAPTFWGFSSGLPQPGVLAYLPDGHLMLTVSPVGMNLEFSTNLPFNGLSLAARQTISNLVSSVVATNVAYYNIQEVVSTRLLGRTSGGNGAAELITLGNGLAFSGSSLVFGTNAVLVGGYLQNGGVLATNTSLGLGISWSPGDDGVYIAGDLYADAFHGVLPAGSLSGSVDGAHGGGGDQNGILKGDGLGSVTVATPGTHYLPPSSTNGFIRSGAVGPLYFGDVTITNATYLDSLTAGSLYLPYTNAIGLATDGNGKVIEGSVGTISNTVAPIITNIFYGLRRFDVRAYGAYPDSPAIPANDGVAKAIHAAELEAGLTNPVVVYFPPGTYYYGNTNAYPGFWGEGHPNLIMVKSNGVHLYGPESKHIATANMSELYNFLGIGGTWGYPASYTNGAPGSTVITNGLYTTNNAVIGMEFDTGNKENVGDITQCYFNWNLLFDGCTFRNAPLGSDAIDVQYGGLVTIQNCFADEIGANGVGSQNEMVIIRNSTFLRCGMGGVGGGAFSLLNAATYVSDCTIYGTNWWDTATSGIFDNCHFVSPYGESSGASSYATNAFCASGATLVFNGCDFRSYTIGAAMIRANAGSVATFNDCSFSGAKDAFFMLNPTLLIVNNCTFTHDGYSFGGGGSGLEIRNCNFRQNAAGGGTTIRGEIVGIPFTGVKLYGNTLGSLYSDFNTGLATGWIVQNNDFYPGATVRVDYQYGWLVDNNTMTTNSWWGGTAANTWGSTNRFTRNRFGYLQANDNSAGKTNYFIENDFGAVVPDNLAVWTNAYRAGNKNWYGVNYEPLTGNTTLMTATNGFFVPTNTMGALTINCLVPDATTNVVGNISFTGLINVQDGLHNQVIRHLVPNGTYTIAFPASWKTSFGGTITTTNAVQTDILVTCQPGVFTNVARLDYY